MTTPTAPIPHPIDAGDQEKQREELAMLEGHDADIHTIKEADNTADDVEARQTSPSPAETGSTRGKDEEVGRISPDDVLGGEGNKHEGRDGQADDTNPNVVFWEGSDDAENPINWKESLKWANVAAIAAITFITYVFLILSMHVEVLGAK